MRSFSEDRSHGQQAAQIWLILVGLAMNRQTIRYRALERLMYRRDAVSGMLAAHVLGRIERYCRENGLPALNTVVVGEHGIPGGGVPVLLSGRSFDEEREAIYKIDWYNIVPPTADELPVWVQAETAA